MSTADSTAQSPEPQEFDPRRRTRNRIMLVALILLGMLPLLSALFVYYVMPDAVSGAQTNRGVLLDPPAQLADLQLVGDDGPVTIGEVRKWRLILVAPKDCDAACLERIHMLRQLHILLGKEKDRVLRLAAFPGAVPPELQARLAREYPDLTVVSAPPDLLATVLGSRALKGGEVELPADGWPEAGVLTVDPLGNVVFFHGLDQIGDPLLSDIRQLLRLSNIG